MAQVMDEENQLRQGVDWFLSQICTLAVRFTGNQLPFWQHYAVLLRLCSKVDDSEFYGGDNYLYTAIGAHV